jgi:ankyrin repeat protein
MGNMDDVVIDVTSNKTQVSFAIQLKHKDAKNKLLSPGTLEAEKGDFSLRKYCESFKALSDVNKQRQFILYTNAKFDPNRTSEVTNFTMIQDDCCDGNTFFNTSSGGNIYRFEVNEKTYQGGRITNADYENFFSRFRLFVGQKNFEGFEQETVEILENDILHIVPKYLDFFRKWHQGKFTNRKMDKDTLNVHLIDIFLSPFIISNRYFPVGQNEKLKLFDKIIKELDVTLVNDSSKHFTENLTDDFNHEGGIEEKLKSYKERYKIESNASVDESIMRIAKEFKIIHKYATVLENEVKVKVLQYICEKPIIVKFNETSEQLIYKIMELHQLGSRIKFILVGQGIQSVRLAKFRIFENVNDLRNNDELYREVTRTCRLSLQGRKETTLEELIDSCKEICEHVGANEVFQMLEGKFLIGQATDSLPPFYINRKVSFKVKIIDEVLDGTFFENNLAVVKFDRNVRKIQNEIRKRNVNVIDVQDYLKSKQISKGPTIISTNKECSRQLLQHVLAKSNKDSVVCLRISEDNSFLIISIEENQIHCLTRPVNILCADPGVGKTTMLKKLRNECDSRFWTIDVDLKTHVEFFKAKHDSNRLLKRLIDGNENSFSKRIKYVFLRSKKVYFFFDGLDEVEKSCVDNVLDFIKKLSSEGFYVWISSRKNLKTKLEYYFRKVAMDMEEVEEELQKCYIMNRLKEKYKDDQIENIISKMFHSSDIDNICQILSKVLHLYITTQIFLDDKKLYQKMIEHTFVFTKMYDLIFRGRFKHNRDKEGSKNPHLSLVKVEDILKIYEHLAVHSLFGEKILEKLNLDLTQARSSLNDFKTNKDILGIVTKVSDEGKALFEHFTYREYFAARFFVNNFDKARLIREELLSDRRKNLMKVLSVILAEDNPLHLAVIYRNVDQIEKYFDDKNIYDKAGRNPLHLATFIEPRCVDRKLCMINVSIEAREYFTNIFKKLVKFNYADCDKLFQRNALEYAFENKCFVFVEMILKTCEYRKEELHQYIENYINNNNLITFCVTHGCIKLLSLILENSEKSKNYFKENASIIIEHTIKNCYFQLEETLHFVIDTLEDKYDFYVNSINERRETLLHLAAMYGRTYAVQMLLEKGASVNVPTRSGLTPLHYAVQSGNSEIVALLIEKRASVHVPTRNDLTPLHYAAQSGNLEIVALLIEKRAHVDAAAVDGLTALHYAAQSGNAAIVALLIEKGASVHAATKRNLTPLHYGAQSGNSEIVALLIKKRAFVHVRTRSDITPLHYAAQSGNPAIVELLIEKGASVHAATKRNLTPLHYAAQRGNFEIVALLIQKRATVDAVADDNLTPLHYAAQSGNSEIVALLIEKGASVHTLTKGNLTPLHYAAQCGHSEIVKLLIEKRAIVDVVADDDLTALHYAAQSENSEIVALLIEKGTSVHAPTKNDLTPLHYAAQSGNSEIVALLIEKGASVHAPTKGNLTPLHYAAQTGNSEIITLLIEKGASLDVVATDNQTPLHRAAQHGNSKTAELLIEKGASVDANDEETPLHCAAQSGNLETVELLIEKGASVNALAADNQTPLHWAAHSGNSKTAELLIEEGASVNALATDNQTPLHWAARSGNSKTAELLIEKGASVDVVADENLTPLHYAAQNGNSEIVALLIEKGASVHATTNSDLTPLHYAAQFGHSELVALIIEKEASVNALAADNQTPLHWAVQRGNAKTVELLIEKGASIHAPTKSDLTPLHYAAQCGNPKIVALLIDKGASVNALANDDLTPLHYSAQSENSEIITLLIERGASVNAPTKSDLTPLHYAAQSGNPEIVALLIEKRASVNALAADNQTPLHWAVQRGNSKIAKLLIDKGASVDFLANDGLTLLHYAAQSGNPEIVALLIAKGVSVNVVATDNQTPLHRAAQHGNSKTAELLIDKGASVDAVAGDELTPLHYAAQSGNYELVALLSEKGASVDAPTISNLTPLHYAAQSGKCEVVALLIEKGASVHVATKCDLTPLHYAAQCENLEIIALLIEKGAFVDAVADNDLTPLLYAAQRGNCEIVALLIEKGASLHGPAKNDLTPLHYTAQSGNPEIVELLIAKGACVDALAADNQTPLHRAAQHGNLKTAELLIEKGASVDAAADDDLTPLH